MKFSFPVPGNIGNIVGIHFVTEKTANNCNCSCFREVYRYGITAAATIWSL